MTAVNERIVRALVDAASGQASVPAESGMCLQFVRLVVERALGLPSHSMYEKWLVAATTRRGPDPVSNLAQAKLDPWAADFEASVKKLGWAVPSLLRQPGDLVFNHDAAKPVGHIGILWTRDLVIENIHASFRPNSVRARAPHISVTPYASRPWTLVARVRG